MLRWARHSKTISLTWKIENSLTHKNREKSDDYQGFGEVNEAILVKGYKVSFM